MARKPTRDIDAHVRRLWRHRGTTLPVPRRGPRQQLNLDQLLDAAVAIADTEGLAAVSTRALAQRFGKTPMALYPYVGSKEQLLALMHDHASTPPDWPEPETGLADALQAWASALFDLYLVHPWLTERTWSQATQGPNEQDWLERLLCVLDRWEVAPAARPSAVTMLYATARACAQTAAAYRRIDQHGADAWLDQARATREQIPDLDHRYPLWTRLTPHAPQWRDSPRAALTNSVTLLATALAAAPTSAGGLRAQTPTNRAT